MALSLPQDFVGKTAVVSGSSGFVGRRLCEQLAERGAAAVIGLDIAPPSPPDASAPASHSVIRFEQCDITDPAAVLRATVPADVFYHIAALCGPFHPKPLYDKVNHQGTLHVLAACRTHKIPLLVYSSSPSTRFDGRDVSGKTEAELPIRPWGRFLEAYAESKARGEVAVHAANGPRLRTIAVAPHQVYGPRDTIFLPNLMEAARSGKLRVFGRGGNFVSMVHVDNYCHGLVLAHHAVKKAGAGGEPAGEFVVVTDGGKVRFWDAIDQAAVYLGYASLKAKMRLPTWLLMAVAYVLAAIGRVTGRSFKLTPFTVKMLTIDRWFNIEKARSLLGYAPLISFEDGWKSTLEWFKENPEFMQRCAKKTENNKVFAKPTT